MKLTVVPCSFREGTAFVKRFHRHHNPSRGQKFAVAVADSEGIMRGVAVVGRPVARGYQDGFTVEVTRVATDGTKNACSMLYATAWRAARALGYRRLITYTLKSERGVSTRAAGMKEIGKVRGRSWHTKSRPRIDKHPTEDKVCWELAL